MTFARPSRSPVAGQAYLAIKRRILDLTFEPGHLLSEVRLSQDFGLSRTPVREALKRLETDGLVDVVPQQGTFVSPIRRSRVMDAQFARSALECALVRLATVAADKAALLRLEANLRDQALAAKVEDFELLYSLDETMHQMIAAIAGRPGVWDLIADMKVHMDRARKLTLQPGHVPTILRQHGAVVAAIRDRDPDAAAAAMDLHLRFVVEHFDEFIGSKPAYTREHNREIL